MSVRSHKLNVRTTPSQHLDVLESAGLIETRRDGRYTFHYVNTEPLAKLADRWLTRPAGREEST